MVMATRSGSSERRATSETGKSQPQRLILCFDGTGNQFQGNPGDTNIVKLYNMLERTNPNQMHYYQPGIGTYPAEGPVNVGFFRGLVRSFQAIIDEGLATSFDAHVIAGYRFLMRYYNEGDRIYIFGFSRGAFTARFLARMISHIGLLSRGNDEMVPFAYKVYQQYEQNRGGEAERTVFMNSFKRHFCRTERDAAIREAERNGTKGPSDNESGIKVHFLGLFDCVNSVGTLDVPFFKKAPPLPAVNGTAKYVRHAVAIDERRVKFKAALFAQERSENTDDVKEVWFPGNHGDIGGGWSLDKTVGATQNVEDDYFQLSDIALKWMVDEIDAVERQYDPTGDSGWFAWEPTRKVGFLRRFNEPKHKKEMNNAIMHDTMRFGGGSGFFKVLFWKWLDLFPFVKRWEFVKDGAVPGGYKWKWDYVWLPLNNGARRDIPNTALFHHTFINRVANHPDYVPNNNMWVKKKGAAAGVTNDDDLLKTSLSVLAKQYQGTKVAEANGVKSGDPILVPAEGKTVNSVAIGDLKAEAAKDEWNTIYSLQPH